MSSGGEKILPPRRSINVDRASRIRSEWRTPIRTALGTNDFDNCFASALRTDQPIAISDTGKNFEGRDLSAPSLPTPRFRPPAKSRDVKSNEGDRFVGEVVPRESMQRVP